MFACVDSKLASATYAALTELHAWAERCAAAPLPRCRASPPSLGQGGGGDASAAAGGRAAADEGTHKRGSLGASIFFGPVNFLTTLTFGCRQSGSGLSAAAARGEDSS